jgi:hypothetical protein
MMPCESGVVLQHERHVKKLPSEFVMSGLSDSFNGTVKIIQRALHYGPANHTAMTLQEWELEPPTCGAGPSPAAAGSGATVSAPGRHHHRVSSRARAPLPSSAAAGRLSCESPRARARARDRDDDSLLHPPPPPPRPRPRSTNQPVCPRPRQK